MTMEPCVYSGLDGEKQIRFLHLLPGLSTSDIRIRLQTVELSTVDTPQHEALSYVWGSREDPANIAVTDGTDDTSRALSITRNLAEALPYLRDHNKTRTLWIDAICIDQRKLYWHHNGSRDCGSGQKSVLQTTVHWFCRERIRSCGKICSQRRMSCGVFSLSIAIHIYIRDFRMWR